MVRRVLFGVAVTAALFAAADLGHASAANPTGLTAWVRAAIGLAVAAALLIALHREARR